MAKKAYLQKGRWLQVQLQVASTATGRILHPEEKSIARRASTSVARSDFSRLLLMPVQLSNLWMEAFKQR